MSLAPPGEPVGTRPCGGGRATPNSRAGDGEPWEAPGPPAWEARAKPRGAPSTPGGDAAPLRWRSGQENRDDTHSVFGVLVMLWVLTLKPQEVSECHKSESCREIQG
ncbi:hypothetical protein VULLAG_LOCUS22779 [Vulpes lagopus]